MSELTISKPLRELWAQDLGAGETTTGWGN